MAPMLGVLVTVLAVVVGLVARWFWRSFRPVQRAEVEAFAGASGLVVTVANGPRVLEAIARTRLWRMVGLLVAGSASAAAVVVRAVRTGVLHVGVEIVLWLLIGYFLGAVLGELLTARSTSSQGPRSASLRRREMTDYVGGWAVRSPRLLAFVGLVAGLAAPALHNRTWWVPAAGIGAAVVWGVTVLVSRFVLERPQQPAAEDLLAADDAIRSRSLHALAATAVGIELWLAALAVLGLALTLPGRLGPDAEQHVPPLLAVVLVLTVPVSAVVVSRRLARRPFRVVRQEPVLR
ncbi:MAG: hypothetical protein ACTHOD_10805 [Motilibacteraceae bacterium]